MTPPHPGQGGKENLDVPSVEKTPYVPNAPYDNGNGIKLQGTSGQQSVITNPGLVEVYGSRTPTTAATPVRHRPGEEPGTGSRYPLRLPEVDRPSSPHTFLPRNNYTRPQEALSETTISWTPYLESSEYVISCQPVTTEEETTEVTAFWVVPESTHRVWTLHCYQLVLWHRQ